MNRRALSLAAVATLLIGALGAAPVQAGGGPVRTSDSYTDTFFDDFIFDLCGIETMTTLTERWSQIEYPNGLSILHVNRKFVPADPRIPIERGIGTSITRPDGSRLVLGMPIELTSQATGKVLLRDIGLVEFDPDGNVVRMVGPHPSLKLTEKEMYCP